MFFSNQVQRLLFPLPQTMFNMGLNIYISHLKDSIISKIYSRLLFQHIFNKNSVSSFGIVYKNVRHSPHKLIILNYGTSAHPLHNSTGLFQKPFVGYGYNHTFVCRSAKTAQTFYFYIIFLCLSVYGVGKYICFPRLYFASSCGGNGSILKIRNIFHRSVNSTFGIFFNAPYNFFFV